jgi:hypothetical protein
MTELSLAVGIGTDAEASSWPSPPRRGRVLVSPRPEHKIQGHTRRPTRGCTRGRIGRRTPSRSLSSYVLSDRCAATELDGATASQTRWLKGQRGPTTKPHPRATNEEPLYCLGSRGRRNTACC